MRVRLQERNRPLRVPTPEGYLCLEVGCAGGAGPQGFYERFAWHSLERLLTRVEAYGFKLESRTPFTVPWTGEQWLLEKVSLPASH